MNIKVLHYKRLTDDERKRLNSSDGGWDSEPRFTRYANVTTLADHDAVREALLLNEYESVAIIPTDDLDEAYRLTNHIDDDWTKNPDVTYVNVGPARSSSVGDILVRDGAYYLVEPWGFSIVLAPPARKNAA